MKVFEKRLRNEIALQIIYLVMAIEGPVGDDECVQFKRLVQNTSPLTQEKLDQFVNECESLVDDLARWTSAKNRKPAISRKIKELLIDDNFYRIGKNPQTGKEIRSENKKEKCMNTNILIWNVMVILSSAEKADFEMASLIAEKLDHAEEYHEMKDKLDIVIACNREIAYMVNETDGLSKNEDEIKKNEQKMKTTQESLSKYFV